MSDTSSSGPPAPPQPSPATTVPRGRRYWMLAGALSLLCLILRLIHLMALPIFGDESIYLRWAQVIRGEGVAWGSSTFHLWVSLADPKPPLHFWLLAAVFHWAGDPLISARLVSVLAGVACVPLMMAIGREFGPLMKPRDKQIPGPALGAVAAVLAIFCPFLAFYQRLATADALFITESLVIVWLSLRWARLALEQSRRQSWLAAAGLGVAIGAGLLTRQGVSYTICALPVAAWLVNASARMDARAQRPLQERHDEKIIYFWLRGAVQLASAGLIAAALWTPYLTAELHDRALALDHQVTDDPAAKVTHDELYAEVKRRIMYQSSFTQAGGSQAALMKRNAFVTFVPAWNIEGNPNSGWLPLYMTPLVFLMCLSGLIYIAVRQRQVAFLLVVWLLLLLAPVVLMVESIYSRYVLAGVPPLLFAGAYLLGDTSVMLWKRALGRSAVLVLWGVILCLPALELWRQTFDWKHQTLTYGGQDVRSDRYQYLTGWTAGYATRGAIKYLQDLARAHPDKPLVIVTTNSWGTPADAVWVYLSLEKNVQMYFTDSKRILRPGQEQGTYRLKDDKWLFPPERNVRFAADAPVYFVANDPVHADVDIPAALFYKEGNPNLPPPKPFYGIEGPKGDEKVVVFQVPRQ